MKTLEEPLKSIQEFEQWKYSVLYMLRLDPEIKPYLREEDFEFGLKTPTNPDRNFLDDTRGENQKTAEEKCATIDFMLDTIAQFCPKIPHNDIVLECKSLKEVWQVIRLHSNIQTSGALLNDIWNIKRLPNETPQALYSRIKQSYDDCLFRANTLVYRDTLYAEDEVMSPTLHCTIILHWLQVLHPRLRDHVTQKFCSELRNVSYAAIWPDICRSVDRFLKELEDEHSSSGVVCRFNEPSRGYEGSRYSGTRFRPAFRARGSSPRFRGGNSRPPSSGHCEYCKLIGRTSYYNHTSESCMFLKKERNFVMGASRAVEVDEEDLEDHYHEFYAAYPDEQLSVIKAEHVINKVSIESSPVLTLYHSNLPVDILLDSGGTCNVIDAVSANELGCEVRPSCQTARLGDAKTLLNIHGETDIQFNRHGQVYTFNALVADIAEPTILGGIPFFKVNDIGIRPALCEISLNKSHELIRYDSKQPPHATANRLRTFSNFLIRCPTDTVVLPGEVASYAVPSACGESVAVEPRYDNAYNSQASTSSVWPRPQVVEVQNNTVSLQNTTNSPLYIKRNAHICNVQAAIPEDVSVDLPTSAVPTAPLPKKMNKFTSAVQVNPDKIISEESSTQFTSILDMYEEVFDPSVGTYNGKSGTCNVEVNMGKQLPPQNKGRVPKYYGRNEVMELQQKMDELYDRGIFRRPQDIGVTVEVVNPCFLVKKKDGISKRLVTDFGQIAPYCRPTPTVLPDVESTLIQIGRWKYIIVSDATDAYFQLRLKKSSMRYCGVASPMKGVMVYTVGCMGLPGTEVALEELTCLLFGDLVMQGKFAKIADDFTMGADTIEELLLIFEQVLQICQENGIKLSARKTVICPREWVILGWLWRGGFLSSTPHRQLALMECDPPETVKGLKSYLGAYRFLSRVIKNYASVLQPLEAMVRGQPALNSKVVWSPELREAFKSAQEALKSAESVVIPKPQDVLHIITDAALLPSAIGAVMFAVREGTPLLAGYFNSKLPPFQKRWLPCEQEGIAIGVALQHFGPYLRQSNHRACLFTDSKACVQAVEKLQRGEYSASSRLTTFLSSVSRYQVEVKHIQGTENIPSDYISRHPISCEDSQCQICTYIQDSISAVVATITVEDVLQGRVHLPFTNKKAWKEVQEECPDLRNVFKCLSNGTKPGKKSRNLRQVKRYLSSKAVISDGTLVIRHLEPYAQAAEKIIVPQQALHGLLTVLHLRLEHPTASQLSKVFSRYFFALNLEHAVNLCFKSCHVCQSLKEVSLALKKQSTDDSPDYIAQHFAADVIKRNKQLILVLRECTSSLTQAEIVYSEKATDIADGLLRLSNLIRPSKLLKMKIRLDPHSAHKSLFSQVCSDKAFAGSNISIELGRELNINHNPVAEKAVRELIAEMLRLVPEGGKISQTQLSQAVASLNSRIRAPGLSAQEIYTQRDQATGLQLSLSDTELIMQQNQRRNKNHPYSEKSKAKVPEREDANVGPGSIVYRYEDKSKLAARPRYLVVSVNEGWCKIKRLTDTLLGSSTYSIKLSEVFSVPDDFAQQDLPPYPIEEAIHPIQMAFEEQEECTVPENEEDELEEACSSCKNVVGDEELALTCDTCLQWCHIGCGNVSQAAYDHIVEEGSEVRWMCPTCITSASDPRTVPTTAVLEL